MLSLAASRVNVPEALKSAAHLQRAGCDSERNAALPDEPTRNSVTEDDASNSQVVAELDAVMLRPAARCESRPGGIRTPDQGIMSPLL